MFSPLGIALLVAATPVKVAVPAFTVVGISPAIADVYSERFVTLLGRDGSLKLTTQKDISQVLGLDRQKQLLGCSDGLSSCLAELAGALGVDAILSVSLAKTGASFTAILRVLNASDGSEIASATERVKSEDALQDWLDGQAPKLAKKVFKVFSQSDRPESGRSAVVRWVPAIGGVALAVGGAVLQQNAEAIFEQARTGGRDSSAAIAQGRPLEAAGWSLMITGGVAIVASVVWVLVAPSRAAQVAVMPTPGGGAVMVGGIF